MYIHDDDVMDDDHYFLYCDVNTVLRFILNFIMIDDDGCIDDGDDISGGIDDDDDIDSGIGADGIDGCIDN